MAVSCQFELVVVEQHLELVQFKFSHNVLTCLFCVGGYYEEASNVYEIFDISLRINPRAP